MSATISAITCTLRTRPTSGDWRYGDHMPFPDSPEPPNLSKSTGQMSCVDLPVRPGNAARGSVALVVLAPLDGEHRVHERVSPLALEHLVVHEVRLAPHAEPFHHPYGCFVARIAPPEHAVQSEYVEAEAQHLACRLGGEAAALELGVEHVPDLALPMLPAAPDEIDLADDPPGLRPLDGDRQSVALGDDRRLRHLLRQRLGRAVAVAGLPVQEPGDLGERMVGVNIVEIGVDERPQGEPFGDDRIGRSQHHRATAGVSTGTPVSLRGWPAGHSPREQPERPASDHVRTEVSGTAACRARTAR